ANAAVGVDNIDLEAAQARGLVVTNTPGVLTRTTADLAMALILDLLRRVAEGDRLVRRGGFKGISPLFHLGRDLEAKTLGVFGLGRIGKALARRARAFRMKIIYHNRRPDLEAEAELKARYVSFDRLLAQSDVISINAPLTDQTRGVFNYRAFERMKPGAFLVNTGRGPIVVEADLVRALKEGLLAGAALDVYQFEPQVHPELLTLDQVVLTPHLGSATWECREKMALMAAGNVLAHLAGREPPNRVV
ncbi:MAG: D-glycerate dehydrogenase, partial [Deltaproteobacteria bacterium]|nr:D-glycerate dehydrogenase [Deltaproteobacteria bacterium]